VSPRLAWSGAAVLLVLLLGAYGVSGFWRIREMRREIARVEYDIAALRDRAGRLTEMIDRLRHDPGFLEKLGREEHGLVREGETVLKFPARPK
jgi:cell division protein FtsB